MAEQGDRGLSRSPIRIEREMIALGAKQRTGDGGSGAESGGCNRADNAMDEENDRRDHGYGGKMDRVSPDQ